MDSSKFKKIDNNTPKNRRNKKKKQNKKVSNRKENKHNSNRNKIITLFAVIIFMVVVGLFIGNSVFHTYMMKDNVLIKPSGFNMTPYGYKWNTDLYGECIAVDANDSESTYYFTLEQMAALAYASDNTYNYSDGLYVSYNTNNSKEVKIVDEIYDKNGDKIVKPDNFNVYGFVTNARFLGRQSPYCFEGFGFTEEEYKDSVF